MTILYLLFLSTGLILGMRFKVYILIPATTLSAFVMLVEGIANGKGLGTLLLMAFFASACLQIGYLCSTVASRALTDVHPNTLGRPSLR